MTSFKTYLLTPLLGIFLFSYGIIQADEIKMKDGTVHNGRITFEGDDLVKIEIAISASIKETKNLSRADIESITKDRPEDIEFNKLQNLVPTRSLMSAGAYKSAIETGPDLFLKNFPESEHVAAVKEMKATLEEELDKVERGFIKLEEDWISPQERAQFETLVESRIRWLRMQGVAGARNYNAIINAMRELEFIEENYYGTPALPKAVELAGQLMPVLGRQLQGMRRDVEFRNAEFEKNKAQMDPVARSQVEAARAREEANYQAGKEADKKRGIKWVRLNPNSRESIESYLKLVDAEMKHLKTYSLPGLKEQAELLEEVDQLVAKNNLRLAKVKLEQALEVETGVAGASGKRPSSKKSKGKTSYAAVLRTKIADAQKQESEMAKAREEAAEAQALTEDMKKEKGPSVKFSAEKGDETPEGADPDEAKRKQKAAEDAFAALAKASKKEESKKSESSKSSKKEKKSRDDDEEEEEDREREVRSSGGGISMSVVIPVVTVLLVVTVILLKVLGIGGNKEE